MLFKQESVDVETIEWSECNCWPLHPRWQLQPFGRNQPRRGGRKALNAQKGGGHMAPLNTPIGPNGCMEAWQLSENVRKGIHLQQWKIWCAFGDLAHGQVPRLPRPKFKRRENWGGHFDSKILEPFSPGLIHMGQAYHTAKPSHYFDSSLLEDEKRRTEMLQAWEGELPKPSSDSKWAP